MSISVNLPFGGITATGGAQNSFVPFRTLRFACTTIAIRLQGMAVSGNAFKGKTFPIRRNNQRSQHESNQVNMCVLWFIIRY